MPARLVEPAGQRVAHDDALDVLHQVERRAEHVRVLADRDRPRHAHRRARRAAAGRGRGTRAPRRARSAAADRPAGGAAPSARSPAWTAYVRLLWPSPSRATVTSGSASRCSASQRGRAGRRRPARRRRRRAGRAPADPGRERMSRHGLRPERPRHRDARAPAGVHGRAGLPGRAGVRRAAPAPRPPPAGRTTCRRSSRSSRPRRASAGCGTCSCPRSSGLSLLDYAPLAELSGWSPDLAPEAMNCAAPDTGQHGGAAPRRHRRAEAAVARPVAGRARSGPASR